MCKLEDVTKFISIIKDALLVIISIIVFVLITKPGAVLNTKSTNESISRERAKLILEIFKDDDINKFKISYNVLKCSYQVDLDSIWFKDLDKLINEWIVLKENENIINENQKILTSKIDLLKTSKEYGRLTDQSINIENGSILEFGNAINSLQKSLNTRGSELIKFRKSSDSIQTSINQRLIRRLK
jgi:hypothetical protein